MQRISSEIQSDPTVGSSGNDVEETLWSHTLEGLERLAKSLEFYPVAGRSL